MGTKPVQTAKANWVVEQNARARKGEEGLPEKWKLIIRALKRSLGKTGKAAGFENFGPLRQLGNDVFHCHLNTGKPRYVAV
ncbi:hypothetical protein [Solidesulfovibrio sp.]|uniref:hypothetical protein n=1 Tax=Solidesulfovibrio sp. TaxID=2910990 RepID=UPI002615AD10|nr:hypothetical protein [Solidesulfovibrio sp.]